MALPTEDAIIAGSIAGRIFGAAGAAERLGVSVSTLKRGWPEGRFPPPIRTSESRIGWLETDIIRWQRDRVAERDVNLTVRNEMHRTA